MSAARPVVRAPADEVAESAGEIRLIGRAILVLFIALTLGLVYWQLVRSRDLAAMGDRQTLRRQIVPARRGTIYDRERRVLAGTRARTVAVLDLGALREEIWQERGALVRDPNATLSRSAVSTSPALFAQARLIVVQRHLTQITAILGRDAPPVDPAAIERHFARDRTTPFVLLDDLTADEVARLTATLLAAGPVRLQQSFQRVYPHGNVTAHVIGRLRSEPTAHASGRDVRTLNVMHDVGDAGAEKQHEARLRGVPGDRLVRLDAAGFAVGSPVKERASSAGQDVTLSLDLDLQLAADQAMAAVSGARGGAAVAVAVETGEILALVSKPDFDLNSVSPRISITTQRQIDANGAWLNRATQALYPPGSVFKIFTALAGLRHGTLQRDTPYQCPGYYEIKGHRFVCHNLDGHGTVTLRRGLAQSCNGFAYQAALAVGPDAIAAEARRFHLGEPTGIDLPFETRGMLVADPRWKETHEHGAWTIGDTINLSIGQGFLRISPLQAACMMASLARRETLTVPTLLRQPDRRPSGSRPAEALGLNDRDYAALIEGLEAVVQTGIGQNAQVPGVRIAGKSGTAQVTRADGTTNIAWFVAFAPIERPEIAIAVALEGDTPGEEFAGAAHAAPVIREIAGTYFDKRRERRPAPTGR